MKANRVIALDIGTDGIRFAVVVFGVTQVKDSGFEAYFAPEGVPQEAVVAMTLKRLLDGPAQGATRAHISIEGQLVFSRVVTLPLVDRDQLEKTIRHEAVQNIPFPINEVVWDSYIIDPGNPEPSVLLVAVKAELVEGLVCAVRANGLAVERISVAPVALANALLASGERGPVLLVDAGTHAVDLVFVDGAYLFFRTLPVAGNDASRLVQEVERSITFYSGLQLGRAPERLLICGDAELDFDLSRPVARVDGASVSVCAGLVVEPQILINLLPDSVRHEQAIKQQMPLWLTSIVLLMLLLAVCGGSLSVLTRRARLRLVIVEQQLADLERIDLEMRPLEAQIVDLNARSVVYRSILQQRTQWKDALFEISEIVPEGMFLLSSEPLRSAEGCVGMRISVVSYLDQEPVGQDAVKALRDALRSSDWFSNKTNVFSRPSKKLFARKFVLDLYFSGNPS